MCRHRRMNSFLCPTSWVLFWKPNTGSGFVNPTLTRISAGGAQQESKRTPVVFQCWGAGKQELRAAGRRIPGRRGRWVWHSVGRRRRPAAQGVVSPAWWTGSRDRAGLQPCLLQSTRCSGRHHDAGISLPFWQHCHPVRRKTIMTLDWSQILKKLWPIILIYWWFYSHTNISYS